MGWGVRLLRGQGACARVIVVLRECIWNASPVSLGLPAFDDTGSRFLAGNTKAELKPTTFSSLLLFRVFLS